MAYISREDCAIAAAHAISNPYLHHAILNINGPEQLTISDLINIGNKITENSVKYQEVSDDEQYAIFDKWESLGPLKENSRKVPQLHSHQKVWSPLDNQSEMVR